MCLQDNVKVRAWLQTIVCKLKERIQRTEDGGRIRVEERREKGKGEGSSYCRFAIVD